MREIPSDNEVGLVRFLAAFT